jgi:hypothetical protein
MFEHAATTRRRANKPLNTAVAASDRQGKASQPADNPADPGCLRHGSQQRKQGRRSSTMQKFGFATVIAGGLTAAVPGFTAPAAIDGPVDLSGTTSSAGIDHHAWLDQITPTVNVPRVGTTVHQSH